jgi:type IV secretory pathway TrbD component
VGDLLNGLAGTLARFLGLESTFWLVMSLGWVLFLAGVLLASQRAAAKTAAAQERDQKEYASS